MNAAIDIIIIILKNWNSYKGDDGNEYEYVGMDTLRYDTENINLWAPKYLLNQIIRQVPVPDNRRYVSDKAQKLWDKLTDDNIWKYNYQDSVKVTNNRDMKVKKYKGSSKKYVEAVVGDSFTFNDVFHDEHIIPIDVIIAELRNIKKIEISAEKVAEILNKICICRITKEEDRNIKPRSNRPFDLKKAYKEAYKQNGVIVSKLEETLINQ